jgi:hypothetical protein
VSGGDFLSTTVVVLLCVCLFLWTAWKDTMKKLRWAIARSPQLTQTQTVIDLEDWHVHHTEDGRIFMLISRDYPIRKEKADKDDPVC